PIIPVGQAYDGAVDGGPAGPPPRVAIHRFMDVAEQLGAVGVSFWSWENATQEQWDAIRDAPWFTIPSKRTFRQGQIRAVQAQLRSFGFGATETGTWDVPTVAALKEYQDQAGLPPTGVVDFDTRSRLFAPFAPPYQQLPR